MRPSRWQVWLSYFVEQHVESTSSEHNPHLYVSLSSGRYQLCTANAVYSFEDRYDNYRKAFTRVELEQLPGKEVLVLGLGLASIPLMLEKIFDQELYYTAVEIDEAVIGLASKYALPEIMSPVELICTDAQVYVAQRPATFDMICMDVFLDDVIPESFEKHNFLEGLKAMLHPKGLLLFNRLAATTRDKKDSLQFFEEHFLKVFPEAAYLDVGGNYMLVNDGGWL